MHVCNTLGETRSTTDSKRTLLSFLHTQLSLTYPDALNGFLTDFSQIAAACRVRRTPNIPWWIANYIHIPWWCTPNIPLKNCPFEITLIIYPLHSIINYILIIKCAPLPHKGCQRRKWQSNTQYWISSLIYIYAHNTLNILTFEITFLI